MDENTALAQYEGADPYAEERVSGGLYGPLKVLSEREAEKWFPGKTTVIRPGLIVGPGDPSGRFTYWPVRIARGGEVLAPNSPQDPTQIIDARDLSQWTIRMAEQGATGIYNATGPEKPRPVGEMLNTIKDALGSNATFTWVPAEFLAEHNVRGWSDLPVWVPPRPENAGFSRVSVDRALAKGLTFRPLATTAKDTLDWYRAQSAEDQARLGGPLTPEREKEVLAAWHAKNG
jgi:2'-hydroxyisoflavone reductase